MAEVLKKQRKSNFSQDEIEVLVKTVGQNYETLYGEYSKKAINKVARHRAWLEVTKEVNLVSNEKRTLQEVKNKWKKCQHLYRPDDFICVNYYTDEVSDVTNVWEPLTELEDEDSMPLEQRLKVPPIVSQSPESTEEVLQSLPLSPTKLKVTRQVKPCAPSPVPLPPPLPPPIEEVCLKWNSHHSNMQHTFPNLLLREQYVDATLVADGQTLKCHRVILSSCSSYFEDVLASISPYQHPVLFMKDVPFWILKCLCDFMYSGEVHILQTKLEDVLAVAEMLKIKGLAGQMDTEIDTKPDISIPVKEEKEDKEIKKKEDKDKDFKKKDEKDIKKKEDKEVKKKEEREFKKKEEKEVRKKEDKEIKKKEEIKVLDIKQQQKRRDDKDIKKKEEMKDKKRVQLTPLPESPILKKRVQLTPSPEMPVPKSTKLPKLLVQNQMPAIKNYGIKSKQKSSGTSKKAEKKIDKEKTPITEKVQKIPITKDTPSSSCFLNPFDLLKPVYEEVAKDPKPPKVLAPKDVKIVNVRRTLQKKLKKRKFSEEREESPPPAFPSRKGTRSRPSKKVPKYFHTDSIPNYDQSTIVREPHTDQADSSFIQLQEIKSEPLYDDSIDIEDNLVGFSETSVSVEEQLIGSFDHTFDHFGRRTTRSSKPKIQPIIMDVHSITNKIDQHVLKIVNVAEIKARDDPLEDPLGLNQSSSESTTMIDNADTSLGFRISQVITEKEDSRSSDVCREMGFQITSVVSEHGESEKMDRITTKIEAQDDEEEEEESAFNEFVDDSASQHEDQKPILLTLIEAEESRPDIIASKELDTKLSDTEASTLFQPKKSSEIPNEASITEVTTFEGLKETRNDNDDEEMKCQLTVKPLEVKNIEQNVSLLTYENVEGADNRTVVDLAITSLKIKEELITEHEIYECQPLEKDPDESEPQLSPDELDNKLNTEGSDNIHTPVVREDKPNEVEEKFEKDEDSNENTEHIQEFEQLPLEEEFQKDAEQTAVETNPVQEHKDSIDNKDNYSGRLKSQEVIDKTACEEINLSDLNTPNKKEETFNKRDDMLQNIPSDKEHISSLAVNENYCEENNLFLSHSTTPPLNKTSPSNENYDENLLILQSKFENQPMDESDDLESNSKLMQTSLGDIDYEMDENYHTEGISSFVPQSQIASDDKYQPMDVTNDTGSSSNLMQDFSDCKDLEMNENYSKSENDSFVPNSEMILFNEDYSMNEDFNGKIDLKPNSSVSREIVEQYDDVSNLNTLQFDASHSNDEYLVDEGNKLLNNSTDLLQSSDGDPCSEVNMLQPIKEAEVQETSSGIPQSGFLSLDDNQHPESILNKPLHEFTSPNEKCDNKISSEISQPEFRLFEEKKTMNDNKGAKSSITSELQSIKSFSENIGKEETIVQPEIFESSSLIDEYCGEKTSCLNSTQTFNENALNNENNSSNVFLPSSNEENKNHPIDDGKDEETSTNFDKSEISCNENSEGLDENYDELNVSNLPQPIELNMPIDEGTLNTTHLASFAVNEVYEKQCIEDSPNLHHSTMASLEENIQNLNQILTENSISDRSLQIEEAGSSNEPGFHIAQVVSEQIAEIGGTRVNEQFASDTRVMNEQCEQRISNSNELESIVDDLSRIVGDSCGESNLSVGDTNSIAESLENLLQK